MSKLRTSWWHVQVHSLRGYLCVVNRKWRGVQTERKVTLTLIFYIFYTTLQSGECFLFYYFAYGLWPFSLLWLYSGKVTWLYSGNITSYLTLFQKSDWVSDFIQEKWPHIWLCSGKGDLNIWFYSGKVTWCMTLFVNTLSTTHSQLVIVSTCCQPLSS